MIISIRGSYIDEALFRKKRFACCVDEVSLVGKTISHYKIVEKLGDGGMGIVYKARDLRLDRFVALKFLNKELLSDEESHQRFAREAKVISAFDHPNIATIHEIDETDDSVFISMAYYEGQTLTECIANKSPLPIEDICSIATQIVHGLAKAHNSGIIHRDIKPANIMITSEGQAKILDFGLAKVVDQTVATEEDSIRGTVAYMSPEQVQGIPVDHRSDIFSFGALLYEMITGKRPFPGEYMASVAYSIVNEEPVSIRKTRPDIPQPFENVVHRALQKQPENRYQNIEEIRDDLEAIRQDVAGSKIVPKTSIPNLKPHLSKRMWLASIGIMLLIFTVTFVLLLQSVTEAPKKISSIAVMPFVVKDAEKEWNWLGHAVMNLLNTELAQYPSVNTIDAQKWNRLQDKLGIQDDGNMTLEETFQIAREAKAENVLMGGVEKHGDHLSLQGQVFNTQSGKLLKEIKTLKGNVSHFYDLVDRLSNELKQSLEFEISSDGNSQSISDLTTQSLDAYKYYLEGRDAALDNRYKEAIPKLNRAIRLDSTFIQAYYYLAWQYAQIYENNKAKEILLKGKPYVAKLSEEERLKYLIQEASADRRWKDHTAYIERLLGINPSDASLHYKYGYTQFVFFRNVDAGIASLERSLKVDSNFSGSYKTLGEAYLASGEKKKAFDAIRQYIRLNPTDVKPLSVMADMQILTGNYEVAIKNCERILMLQPGSHTAWLHKSRVYIGQRKLNKALDNAKHHLQSVSLPAHKADAHLLLARIYFHQNEFVKALDQVRTTLDLDPAYEDAFWLSGLIQLKLGNRSAAIEQLEELEQILDAQEELTDMWLLYHLKAEISIQEEEYKEAIDYLTQALELAPLDKAFYLSSLGNAYARSQQHRKAIKTYRKALSFNPKHIQAALGLAMAFEQQNKVHEALEAYQNVITTWKTADEGVEEIQTAKERVKHLKSML
ncbi:protein kinase [candidate division KSB1 bacterium]|nr:protein kinase [candidate division KSB1 bacterium]NIR71907.1 protein kinase [candidate division KSB1 bacterium]NIS23797.1 protein kinase [candidate division KSB1 bacterium]NIT70720.1 protein kinase [candidate division KSB1 bacterium]NIU24447.1 protein kinase [candidate division KSB1 bacterium]